MGRGYFTDEIRARGIFLPAHPSSRGPATHARRPQSGPTGPPERPIRRLPRRAGGSRLAPMTSQTGDSMATGPAHREAAERLARLGFVVVNGSHPEETGTAQLLIALRSRPTQEHFDAELVER